ncbi:TMEM175 family protein [Rhodococcus sp. IEGM 1379]|uniref:TMEM175 family protein n=1 Tax=Rhodococcus sp. IEGM 1379 TaxID=3047086 RepID=UPI0024B797D3|nr:TMEM175 family protein [Rhodococcus sp. IEGM 1379]MDI9914964.1 TMEM175 family protein [Rhodococcus sp. IEGM 1379]
MAGTAERTRYFDRYVTFIDAIAAIAITLLVLPLVELTNDHDGTTAELLRDHTAQFYAFGLSFVVIFRFWWSQHRLLRFVIDGDAVGAWRCGR